jgi:restriction system protein
MLPTLRILSDRKDHSLAEINDLLAKQYSLSSEEQSQRNESGQTTFYNRAAWARTYLKAAGLLDSPKYGIFRITSQGEKILTSNPKGIDLKFLRQFPSFVQFRNPQYSQ